ncbi:OmpA family protein [Aquimarina gracilis]|uniref:OmpA family protein n=1 Tax=Aquimarina gracilis TaxID=874422 RepID=A0ABU5ZXM3_9FLAO|nr:OmpA family protein [Aquimarina gracilis]MEB3346621.1 OmpA family protein [Aquimarina gracilis]
MKNFISLLIFLLFAWLGIWWYYSCDWCAKSTDKDPTIVEEEKDSNTEALSKKAYEDSIVSIRENIVGLFVKDKNDQELFSYSDNLQINNSNGDVLIPSSLIGFENQIVDYLGKNQDQELVIQGYENYSERQDKSEYGLSRANFIKDILVKAGINPNRIVTEPKLIDYSYKENGIYEGGILLNFNTLDTSRIAEIEKSVAYRTLYSNFAQKTFKPDPQLVNYVLELKNYLSKYPNKKIQIIGHTDDVGDEEANLWFGQERANNVKKYLISQGIEGDKIIASSKGESSPIVPNDTEENKAKNRRIEITVN